ncbi:MAG: response regulator [Alphaproteobacteria bacterium]|jgi:CheY-like chemotaxis protein|nr:response regulator [Alphaproteobacteria bacterium]MDP6516859.1 response regulator [Alphaproteobacteria bacterium]|tara:strand:- start:112 stop:402 length:291 start_codon:yes stop_codon:yes gene_type:complete
MVSRDAKQGAFESDWCHNPDIDLLLTDLVLPGAMTGRDLAGEARHRQPVLKVLYMSGYTSNALLHHGRLDADAELLQKPFRKEDLARKLRSVLDSE